MAVDRLNELIEILKKGSRLSESEQIELKDSNLIGADLSGLDLSEIDLSNTQLLNANLSGCNFYKADLSKSELSGANLKGSNFTEAALIQTGLGFATLDNTVFFSADLTDSTLTESSVKGADFRCAILLRVRARNVDISETDFSEADLSDINLSLSNVTKTNFSNTNLSNARLRSIKGYDKANWLGVDIRNINFSGAYMIRRFIVDQNYIFEFRHSTKLNNFLYYLWWLSSDCGRSIKRWLLFIMFQTFLFTFLYSFVKLDKGEYPSFLSEFYFSIVTMTTLGFGDVVPASLPAQILTLFQVLTGYVMLGGFLSILASKMGRRAD